MVIEQEIAEVTEVRTPTGVTISLFDGDWDGLDSILTSNLRMEFERRANVGRACLIARRGDRVIGYTWMSTSIDTAIEEIPLALPDDAAYLWDLFVVQSERGTGVGSALTSARLAWTKDQGLALGWRVIAPKNGPSVRTAEKTGAVRILGEIRIDTRLGRTRFSEERSEDRPLLSIVGEEPGERFLG